MCSQALRAMERVKRERSVLCAGVEVTAPRCVRGSRKRLWVRERVTSACSCDLTYLASFQQLRRKKRGAERWHEDIDGQHYAGY